MMKCSLRMLCCRDQDVWRVDIENSNMTCSPSSAPVENRSRLSTSPVLLFALLSGLSHRVSLRQSETNSIYDNMIPKIYTNLKNNVPHWESNRKTAFVSVTTLRQHLRDKNPSCIRRRNLTFMAEYMGGVWNMSPTKSCFACSSCSSVMCSQGRTSDTCNKTTSFTRPKVSHSLRQNKLTRPQNITVDLVMKYYIWRFFHEVVPTSVKESKEGVSSPSRMVPEYTFVIAW